MKEATGEFSMTVVTILAIVVIAGVIAIIKDPLTEYIKDTWMNIADQEIEQAGD